MVLTTPDTKTSFSPADINYASANVFDVYLGTPGGTFGKVDSTGNITYQNNTVPTKPWWKFW